MTIAKALSSAAAMLGAAGVPDSRLDAEYLLAHVLKIHRMALAMRTQEDVPEKALAEFDALLSRRKEREPLQYILSCQPFMGHTLYVDENVLIPRPETELLCEQAIVWLRARKDLESPTVLDLCTGSGAIAIALSKAFPGSHVHACDLSEMALHVARRNTVKMQAKVTFHQGNFLSAVDGRQFDLIVCNPPYIPTDECRRLQAEVQREPLIALDGGGDGLAFYRRLASEAPRYLCPGGALFCEVGHDQAETVRGMLAGHFARTGICHDMSGIPRIVFAVSPNTLPGGIHVRQV